MTATKQNTAEAGRGSGFIFGEGASWRPWNEKGSTLAPDATGWPAPGWLAWRGGLLTKGIVSKEVCEDTSTFFVTGWLSDLHKKGLRDGGGLLPALPLTLTPLARQRRA